MSEASLEQMAAASDEHLVAGREIHLPDVRGYRFCEVGLISGTSQDNAIANIWNTTGVWDPTDEQFDALDADAIARENGALRAWLNPVRCWMFDRLDVWEAGDDKSFGGITGTWMGVADAATMIQATVRGSYHSGYMYRKNTCTYGQGSQVYLLDAPDGEAFIMQSSAGHREAVLSEDDLAHLGQPAPLPPAGVSVPRRSTRTWRSRPTATTSRTSCRTTCATSTRARM